MTIMTIAAADVARTPDTDRRCPACRSADELAGYVGDENPGAAA